MFAAAQAVTLSASHERRSYTRDQLLQARGCVWCSLSPTTASNISAYGQRRHRGSRAGRNKQRSIPVIDTRDRQPIKRRPVAGSGLDTRNFMNERHAVNITTITVVLCTLRHAAQTRNHLQFGAMNLHSVNDKIDNILSLRRERDLDVLLLCETWHDSDSVCIRRLRADGM